MNTITYISTRHKESGKCNADELCSILSNINPDVVFVEAFDNTYHEYSHFNFKHFGIYHNKLEIKALQKYSHKKKFEYITLLKNELGKAFDDKYELLCKISDYQMIVDKQMYYVDQYGFEYLNSNKAILHLEQLDKTGRHFLQDDDLYLRADSAIDQYENDMLDNIYDYCEKNSFESAVFLCGAGHRKSIIEKAINNSKITSNINWKIIEFDLLLP